MEQIKIGLEVWTKDLGVNDTEMAIKMLDEAFAIEQVIYERQHLFKLQAIDIQYESEREQFFDGRLGRLFYTGKAYLTGLYY
jgi:hypothetical protein